VDVGAWCGRCGESFRLGELVADGFSGRCPRCDLELAPGYLSVASAAVHEVLSTAATLEAAVARLHEVAPRLHLDGKRVGADLLEAMGES
jgi:hypothetical protein